MARTAGAAPGRRTAPPGWPALNSRVHVRVHLPEKLGDRELELPTRVEDEVDGALVVAAPTFAGDLHVAVPGLPVAVSWSSDRGRCVVDAVLVRVVRHRVSCWELEPASDVRTEQRRRYARVRTSGHVRVLPVPDETGARRPPAPPVQPALQAAPLQALPALRRALRAAADGRGEDPAPAAGATGGTTADAGPDVPVEPELTAAFVDLSEGGACLRLAEPSWLTPGRRVRVLFDLAGGPVDQLAEVVRVAPARDVADRHDVVLAFVEPVPAADRLRQHVMRTQIDNRRRGDR
ncbi:PilZ domain-containing protein [Kineococcus sp. SYSU DK004]|uniref:PilZ domain-containing protein n=1 Tax=Kineococcus sp. SYSU DK004 TaxID=3383125 RepID=UPI003D7E21FE